MALGAGQRDVLKLVVGHGMILTLIGIAFGLGAAFVLTRFVTASLMSSLLFEVSVTDLTIFAIFSASLTAVAFWPAQCPRVAL